MKRNATTLNPSAAMLWASAFVIAAFIIVQAGRLPGNPAHADMTIVKGDYTLLTTDSGRGGTPPNEMLFIIDSRDQVLLMYEVEDARRGILEFRGGGSIANLFLNARR